MAWRKPPKTQVRAASLLGFARPRRSEPKLRRVGGRRCLEDIQSRSDNEKPWQRRSTPGNYMRRYQWAAVASILLGPRSHGTNRVEA